MRSRAAMLVRRGVVAMAMLVTSASGRRAAGARHSGSGGTASEGTSGGGGGGRGAVTADDGRAAAQRDRSPPARPNPPTPGASCPAPGAEGCAYYSAAEARMPGLRLRWLRRLGDLDPWAAERRRYPACILLGHGSSQPHACLHRGRGARRVRCSASLPAHAGGVAACRARRCPRATDPTRCSSRRAQ